MRAFRWAGRGPAPRGGMRTLRWAGRGPALHFQDHRHDQRTAGRFLYDEALQVGADLLLHDTPIGLLLLVRALQRLGYDLPRTLHECRALLGQGEAAAHNLGQALDTAGMAVDGDDREHDAVL